MLTLWFSSFLSCHLPSTSILKCLFGWRSHTPARGQYGCGLWVAENVPFCQQPGVPPLATLRPSCPHRRSVALNGTVDYTPHALAPIAPTISQARAYDVTPT